MTAEIFANLPWTAVTSGGTTATAQGAQETWTVPAASGATFPQASSSGTPPTQFHCVDWAAKSEIIACINCPTSTTWTVIRGAENTTPVAHAPGFSVWQAVTAGGLSQFVQVTGAVMAGYLAPAVVSLTFGATIAVNAAAGNDFRLTLASSAGTISTPSNPVNGQMIEFQVTQGGSGSNTLAWAGSAFDFGTAGAPVLSTAAGAIDIIGFKYNAAKGMWLCTGSALGF